MNLKLSNHLKYIEEEEYRNLTVRDLILIAEIDKVRALEECARVLTVIALELQDEK